MRAIIDPALQLMMDAVHRYDGYVAQALGDGIFALFGAPIAHEDHSQRALYAALRMQEEMRRYSDELRRKGRAPLPMRVGVNIGEVVVRSIRKDDLHTDYVPVGHSTNLAARMEQLASPGSIVVTPYMYKLTNGYFEFRALGQTQIKGVDALHLPIMAPGLGKDDGHAIDALVADTLRASGGESRPRGGGSCARPRVHGEVLQRGP